jgi:hypothetical protein
MGRYFQHPVIAGTGCGSPATERPQRRDLCLTHSFCPEGCPKWCIGPILHRLTPAPVPVSNRVAYVTWRIRKTCPTPSTERTEPAIPKDAVPTNLVTVVLFVVLLAPRLANRLTAPRSSHRAGSEPGASRIRRRPNGRACVRVRKPHTQRRQRLIRVITVGTVRVGGRHNMQQAPPWDRK